MKTMIIGLLLAMTGSGAMAQGTVADYKRADSLRYKYSWKVANSEVKVHRMRDSHKFWYSVWDGRKMVYKEVDADSNKVSILPENPEKPQPRPQRRHDRRQHYWSEVPDEKTGWQVSPVDSMLMVFHRDNNLWTRRGQDVKPLTTNGDSTYY